MLCGEEDTVFLYDCSDKDNDFTCIKNNDSLVFLRGSPGYLVETIGTASPLQMFARIDKYLKTNYPAVSCFFSSEFREGIINKTFDNSSKVAAVCTLNLPFNTDSIFAILNKIEKK